MLVSEAELQISDDHDGIIDLPDDAPIGDSLRARAGLDDPLIEINLTPNRRRLHRRARRRARSRRRRHGQVQGSAIKPVKASFPVRSG